MEINLLIAAIILGFTTSFHCIGMCGPIALSLGLSKKQATNYYLQNILYQLGRVFTYTIMGLLLGLLGKSFQLIGFQSYLSIFSGIVLMTMAFFSFGGKDFASKIKPISKILLKIKMKLGKYLQKTDVVSRFTTGVLNGFLPCGMVYAALTAALAANGVVQSALFMMFFGLGTIPFMFAIVLLGDVINLSFRNRVMKIVPIFIFLMGFFFVLRGLNLDIPMLSPSHNHMKIEQKTAGKKSCCQ